MFFKKLEQDKAASAIKGPKCPKCGLPRELCLC